MSKQHCSATWKTPFPSCGPAEMEAVCESILDVRYHWEMMGKAALRSYCWGSCLQGRQCGPLCHPPWELGADWYINIILIQCFFTLQRGSRHQEHQEPGKRHWLSSAAFYYYYSFYFCATFFWPSERLSGKTYSVEVHTSLNECHSELQPITHFICNNKQLPCQETTLNTSNNKAISLKHNSVSVAWPEIFYFFFAFCLCFIWPANDRLSDSYLPFWPGGLFWRASGGGLAERAPFLCFSERI